MQPIGEKAPDFPDASQWLNSERISLDELRGEIVALLFFRLSCGNCLPLLPFVDSWLQTYGPLGLTVIGVHTPQYDFEASPANVRIFVEDHLVAWPVILDNESKTWSAYQIEAWPTIVLVDAEGRIRYRHTGEHAYASTEDSIRDLIQETSPGVDLGLVQAPSAETKAGPACYPATREVRCGYRTGRFFDEQEIHRDAVHFYALPQERPEGVVLLDGAWIVRPDCLERPAGTGVRSNVIVRYTGIGANAVMTPGAGAGGVNVLQDGYPLAERIRGRDLMVPGRFTIAEVDRGRIYNLVRDAPYGEHELRVETDDPGVRIYAFTFSGCEREERYAS